MSLDETRFEELPVVLERVVVSVQGALDGVVGRAPESGSGTALGSNRC
jgi:hypothetical protein